MTACGPTFPRKCRFTASRRVADPRMAFHEYPFPEDTPQFPWHYQVKHYLQDYAAAKGWVWGSSDMEVLTESRLNDVIQFQHRVLAVYHTPGTSDPAEKWTVETENTITRLRHTERVSHVIVSNGHYNEPYIPRVRGLDGFTGKVFHSRWWRNPFEYEGKNVLVVGSKSSGSDIARELAVVDHQKRLKGEKVTRRIYQSIHGLVDPKKPTWDDDLEWAKEINVVSQIDHINGDVLHLIDGKKVTGVDVIFYATGYLFSYPFCHEQEPFASQPVTVALSPPEKEQGIPKAGGKTITNLDQSETFYAPDPTLALINLRKWCKLPSPRTTHATPRLPRQPVPPRRDHCAASRLLVRARRGAASPSTAQGVVRPTRHQHWLSPRVHQHGQLAAGHRRGACGASAKLTSRVGKLGAQITGGSASPTISARRGATRSRHGKRCWGTECVYAHPPGESRAYVVQR